MSVTVGRFHTCAVRNDGAVLCAGKNDNGELSSGDTERRATLTRVQ
jgi:alpha-tubulin suppressor-like RCC1 family protein